MAIPAARDTPPRRVVPGDVARQGEATGHVRYVLGGSLALTAVAGVVLYLIFAL